VTKPPNIPADSLATVVQLAATVAVTPAEETAVRQAADFVDTLGVGPMSSAFGDNQTVRQFVDGILRATAAAVAATNADQPTRALTRARRTQSD
jgi:hypothetical protein